MNEFRVETHREGAALVAAPSGEIDSHNVDRLRDALADAVAASDSALVIDLTHVQTLDSSGLGALLDIHALGEADGVEITLVYSDPVIGRAIEISGLDAVFTRATSVAEAARDT